MCGRILYSIFHLLSIVLEVCNFYQLLIFGDDTISNHFHQFPSSKIYSLSECWLASKNPVIYKRKEFSLKIAK